MVCMFRNVWQSGNKNTKKINEGFIMNVWKYSSILIIFGKMCPVYQLNDSYYVTAFMLNGYHCSVGYVAHSLPSNL